MGIEAPLRRVALPDLTHGDHGCLFFSTPADQQTATVRFLAAGLERNERCVFVGDPGEVEGVRRAFRDGGMDTSAAERANRLIFSSEREYLDAGMFSPEKMLGFLQEAYDAALGDGFDALRAAGDVAWQVGPHHDFRDVVSYEALLDFFFIGKRMVGLCEYPRRGCPPETLAGILETHRVAAVDTVLCDNTHYVAPEIHMEKNQAVRQERRVEWMTAQLLRARAAEDENRRLNAELEQRVADRTRELMEANRDLEMFAYAVSHDLRGPLQVLTGYAGLVETNPASAATHAGRIREGAGRMAELLDNLLRFFKSGREAFVPADVDMTSLARSVAAEVGAAAVIAGLPPARGDAALLRQVLVNLLTNAVKFTRGRAEPRIEIGWQSEGDRVAYAVSDNGVGFDPADVRRLFGAFQRLHPSSQYPGTGLGLAIVDRIIRKHGGEVRAEGRPGAGATFTFILPRAVGEPVPPAG